MSNLWPADIAGNVQRSPVVILREQASFLGNLTGNQVIGDVVKAENVDNTFRYNFYLRAPALGDYRYLLFVIQHDVGLYPLTLIADEEIFREITHSAPLDPNLPTPPQINRLRVASEQDFIDYLIQIFASQKVRRIVGGILSQVEQPASIPG